MDISDQRLMMYPFVSPRRGIPHAILDADTLLLIFSLYQPFNWPSHLYKITNKVKVIFTPIIRAI
ncbi:hypothetical protein ACPV4J_13595 [Photobacterium swingsii]